MSTYNRSIKIMFNLPYATHRYLLEPLSGLPHVSRVLVKRFIAFIDKIRNSSKPALKHLLEIVEQDVRLTTGFNLRYIMLLTGKNKIDRS